MLTSTDAIAEARNMVRQEFVQGRARREERQRVKKQQAAEEGKTAEMEANATDEDAKRTSGKKENEGDEEEKTALFRREQLRRAQERARAIVGFKTKPRKG